MGKSDGITVSEATDEARQGETGHHVRYILGAGLIGILMAFAAVALLF
jgi:hypothetical protein